MFFAPLCELGARPPCQEGNNHGMDVLCQVPCVVKDAGLFAVVMLKLLGNAHTLREKT